MTKQVLCSILKEARRLRNENRCNDNISMIDYIKRENNIMERARDKMKESGWYCMVRRFGHYNGYKQYINKYGLIVEERLTEDINNRRYVTVRNPVGGYDRLLDLAIEFEQCPTL